VGFRKGSEGTISTTAGVKERERGGKDSRGERKRVMKGRWKGKGSFQSGSSRSASTFFFFFSLFVVLFSNNCTFRFPLSPLDYSWISTVVDPPPESGNGDIVTG